MPICFLDSNLFIAVALEESLVSELLIEKFIEDETLTPVISSVVIDEIYHRVRFLKGRMAAWQATQFAFRLPRLRLVLKEQFSPLLPVFAPKVKDPDDLPHICAAVVAQCDWFISLNRKLARETSGVSFEIVTPEEWLEKA